MHQLRRRFVFIIAAVILTVGGVAVFAPASHPATGKRIEATNQASVGAVFYSGKGAAGSAQASKALFRYTAARQYWPDSSYNGLWTQSGTTCGTANAAQFPSSSNGTKITELTGFSLGRLGPVYFLDQAPGRASQINYILLLDPGSTAEFTVCDSNKNVNVKGVLASWLGLSSTHHLVIVAGSDTAANSFAGLTNTYLPYIEGTGLASQVLVCETGLSHDDVMKYYANWIGETYFSCPPHVNPLPIPGPPSSGSGGGGSNPPSGGTSAGNGNGGGGGTGSGGGSTADASIIASQGAQHGCATCYALNAQVQNFPLGTYTYTCHDNSGAGGSDTVFFSSSVTVSNSSQSSWPGVFCDDNYPYTAYLVMDGIQSNSVTFPSAGTSTGGGGTGSGGGTGTGGAGGSGGSSPPPAASITISEGGQYGCSNCYALDAQVHNFPLGTYTYYCHDNSGGGGSDTVFFSHSVTVSDPNQSSWPGVFCDDNYPYIGYLVMDGVQSNSIQFGSAPAPPPPPPPPPTYSEQASVNHVVPTFAVYHNASNQGPNIGVAAWVQVSCKVLDGTIASVNPDGYWYRIASAPWNNNYYAPANTFMNGDPPGGPYLHNTDFSVPNC